MDVENTGTKAILTRYLGPTDYRDSRIKAHCDGGSVTISFDYDLDASENHAKAARALIEKLGWDDRPGRWVRGGFPTKCRDSYAFVRVPMQG